MASAYFRMLIHELLNNNLYIVTEESPLIVLDINSSVCIANNVKYTNNTRHVARRVHFVRNCENCRIHKI